MTWLNPDEQFARAVAHDRFHDECGVVGIAGNSQAAHHAYLALYALQHRGQESCGIVSRDARQMHVHKAMGLVADTFSADILQRLPGRHAIGHVRYSTAGSSSLRDAQPLFAQSGSMQIAVAHNGNLTNAAALRRELEDHGSIFQSSMDSEVFVHLFARARGSVEERLIEMLGRVRGAFSMVMMIDDVLIAARDPHGFRPLSIGRLDSAWVVASETCAFDLIGAMYERDVEPGEIVVVRRGRLRSIQPFPRAKQSFCVFEHIYFSRPDSRLEGRVLQEVRGRMGAILAREAPVEADLVIAVPDSGNPAANGFARESGLPKDDGLIKNRYVQRTFIQPGQELRKHGLRMKFNPLPEIVSGKRVVVVDDSIVRGNTTRQIIGMLRDAGASEVHLRISAPPIRYPCHYGVDMSTSEEMIAHGRSVEEIAAELGADSLAYISLDGVYEAVGTPREVHCDACFTGEYPLGDGGDANGKFALEGLPVVQAAR